MICVSSSGVENRFDDVLDCSGSLVPSNLQIADYQYRIVLRDSFMNKPYYPLLHVPNYEVIFIFLPVPKLSYILLLFCPLLVIAQKNPFAKASKEVEAATYISTSGGNPFWLRSNQYGIIPLESQGMLLRARIATGTATAQTSLGKPTAQPTPGEGELLEFSSVKKSKSLSFDYALDVVANIGQVNRLLIPEAYAAIKWKAFELYTGRRREIVGLVDSTLSAGSFIWSGNALPLPKVQLSIPEYTSIIGKGLISIKGSYAHGWFDNGYVENFFLHQKTLYGRVGRSHWKVKFYGGFNHQVQWGGKPATPIIEVSPTGEDRLITKFPSGWNAYYQVVTGQSLNKDQNGGALIEEGVPFNEAFNRAGNHLGTVDVGAEFMLNTGRLTVYRQSIYEDGSLFYLNNISDGLVGISYKAISEGYGVKHLTFEYLKTSNQGGRGGSGNTIPELRGQDSYFDNGLYRNGWTYNGNVIGSPFLTTTSAIKKSNLPGPLPVSALGSGIMNNRVHAFTLSMASHHQMFDGLSRVSISRNFGTYGSPIDFTNFSLYQEAAFPWKSNYLATLAVGVDGGQLFGTQAGIMAAVKRKF